MELNPREHVYNLPRIKKIMHYYLIGEVKIAEEMRMASIQYYEGGELEEPKSEELAS